MTEKPSRQPGDLILDRYMPNASKEEREEARKNLKAYVAFVMRLHQRQTQRGGDNEPRETTDEGIESQDYP